MRLFPLTTYGRLTARQASPIGLNGSVKNVHTADRAVLRFGHLRQENQDLIAVDLTHISDHTGTEISGILGFTLLRLLDVKIDYRDGQVDFSYNPKP